MSTTDTPASVTPVTTTGRVKWFNNRAGYGFITVTSGDHDGIDVFVHHSAISVDHEQYRYLVQGEYVDFILSPIEDATHKWQASTVKGMHGGKLMCETRLESRESRTNYSNEHRDSATQSRGADTYPQRVRMRGPGPRDGDEWMLVRRKRGSYNDAQDSSRQRGRNQTSGRNTSNMN